MIYRHIIMAFQANRSARFIKDQVKKNSDKPFLMMLSTPAPHSPWNAAPKYSNEFANATAPRTPNYNKRGKVWKVVHFSLHLSDFRNPNILEPTLAVASTSYSYEKELN